MPVDITGSSIFRRPTRFLSPVRTLLAMALPLALIVPAMGGSPAQAAGVNPLPAVAKALTDVKSYQVTITNSINGTPGPRPTGTPRPRSTPGARRGQGFGFGRGMRSEVLTVVRKGNANEDYFVLKGTDTAGKPTETDIIVYGGKVCQRTSPSSSFQCQTQTNGNQFLSDPTAAFAQGAGSSTKFATAGTKTVGGQACLGYSYSFTTQMTIPQTSRTVTSKTSGVVYISRTTNLPCEQIATTTSRGFNGTGTFGRTSTIIWSRFNDSSLTVPAVPA